MSPMPRLNIFTSHPTPFEGPLYPKIDRRGHFGLKVYFWRTDQPVRLGEGGIRPHWDNLPLTEGYEFHRLPPHPMLCWRFITKQAFGSPDRHVALVNGWSEMGAILALVAARHKKIPIMLRLDTVDLYPAPRLRHLRRLIIRSIIYRYPIAFMAVSSLTRQHLERRGIRSEAIFSFPYSLDNDFLAKRARSHLAHRAELRHALDIDPHSTVIMAALKFVPREGAEDLVRVFATLTDWHDSTTLLLVGDGPMRGRLENLISQNDSAKVILPGWVPYSRLIQLFALSDLFVHPGLEEPWGCSIQEAAACRLPIVSSDLVGAAHDLVRPSINGLRYQGGNVEALRIALSAMLRNREQWSSMGESSWEIVQDYGHSRCLLELERAMDYALRNAQ
jgi:glycosyltransferase involved in cell wall biosynthesis